METDVFKSSVAIQFIDAKTGEQVGFDNSNQKVKISILGEDASSIVNNVGTNKIEVDKGVIVLAVAKDVTPSTSNPVKFRIIANANGYLTTSKNFTIVGESSNNYVVEMVKISDTPKGVSAIESNIGNSSNGTTSNVSISTPTIDTDYEETKASVNIPQGTKLRDKNGNLISGTINSTFVYFNNQDESSLNAFPGGLAGNTTEVGLENINFVTAGFVALEMETGSGSKVKSFDTPIQMNIEIPENTFNNDGTIISDGMTLPIWSYDTETGLWSVESEQTINYNSTTGKYEVSFEMEHLSYWNLDWHYPGGCSVGATITISSNITSNYIVSTKLKYQNTGNYYYTWDASQNIKNGSSYTFLNAFPNVPMIVEFYASNSGCSGYGQGQTKIGECVVSNLCSGNYTAYINYNPPSPISVSISASCASNPGQIYIPSLYVYAKDVSCSYSYFKYIGYMSNGEFSTNQLVQGRTYRFAVWYAWHWIEAPQDFTINQSSYTYNQILPSDICAYIN